MRHFTLRPVYIYIAQSSTKYFVARQRCIGNTLHFHGSRHQFLLLTVTCLKNAKGTHCVLWQNSTFYIICDDPYKGNTFLHFHGNSFFFIVLLLADM